MSKKSSRVDMLIQMNNSLQAISSDAKNQSEQSIKENMSILSNSVVKILALDNVFCTPANEKVEESTNEK